MSKNKSESSDSFDSSIIIVGHIGNECTLNVYVHVHDEANVNYSNQ